MYTHPDITPEILAVLRELDFHPLNRNDGRDYTHWFINADKRFSLEIQYEIFIGQEYAFIQLFADPSTLPMLPADTSDAEVVKTSEYMIDVLPNLSPEEAEKASELLGSASKGCTLNGRFTADEFLAALDGLGYDATPHVRAKRLNALID